MEKSIVSIPQKCIAGCITSQHSIPYCCDKDSVKNSKFCEKHRKIELKKTNKKKCLDLFRFLDPAVVAIIIGYSRASNVLRAVNSRFRNIIKRYNIEAESGWYGAIQASSYSLSMFLIIRKAPIELYIASNSKGDNFKMYRD